MAVTTFLANIKGPRGLKGELGEKGLPGVNGVENASAVAEYIDSDTVVRDALDTGYARLGVDATQRLMALMHNEARDASILVVTDSTGNEEWEWVFSFSQQFAAEWAKWTVKYRLWNDTTSTYDAAVTIQTGAGARTLTIWNSAVPGYGTFSWQGARANAAMYSLSPDLVMVSVGHNEQALAPDAWHSRYLSLTESIAWNLPGADILLIAQNPATANTLQQQRAEVYREVAARRGYGFVDVGQAFLDTGNAPGLTLDGIHPNVAGTALWVATVKAAFVFQPGGRKNAQPPTPLTQVGENLLLNPDFTAKTTGIPDNWAMTAGMTAVTDTVNFETTTFNRATGGGTPVSQATKFTAAAGAAGQIWQYVPPTRVRGRWVTIAARIYVPAGSPSSVARIGINDTNGSTLHVENGAGTGAFSWVIVSRYIAPTVATCRVLIFVDAGLGGGNCTIERVVMTVGKYPNGR